MDGLLHFESQILLFIQEHIRCPALTGIMRFASLIGDVGAVWIVITLGLLLFRKTRRMGSMCAIALLIGLLVTNICLKNIIHRIRPYDVINTLNILVKTPTDFSFPSGHTTSSFAAGWVLLRTAPRRWGIPALLLAVLIAFSRMYVGVHYPTDILAGVIIGVCAAEIARCALKPRRKSA